MNQKEYIPILSPEAGVRVLIKRQRSIPFPVDEGFTVSPGFATSIGLRQVCLEYIELSRNRPQISFDYKLINHAGCW